jgi:hypothetical protein
MTLMLCGITIAIYITRQTGYWEKPWSEYGYLSLLFAACAAQLIAQNLEDGLHIYWIGITLLLYGITILCVVKQSFGPTMTRIEGRVLIALLIISLARFPSQENINNSSLAWIMLTIGSIIIFKRIAYRQMPWLKYSFSSLLVVAAFSEGVLLLTYIPATIESSQDITHDATQENWGEIGGPFNYQALKERILEVAKICKIAPDSSSQHVMIDFVTYLALKSTYQPYRIVFALHDFDQPEQLFPFLKKAHSSGIVTLCRTLPENIRPYAQEENGVCCLSQDRINSFPAE